MLITALIFILILSILVMIHELGHFLVAKKFGIKVEEFGFGLPPRVFGKKIGETIYSINWLPIGGFVRLLGEDRDTPEAEKANLTELKERAFYNRPVWQRSLVLVAGVFMNFFLAVVVISYLFTQGVMVPTQRVHVEKIQTGSPAEEAGLRQKDIIKIIKFTDKANLTQEVVIKNGDALIQTTRDHLGEKLILVIDRDGRELQTEVTPRKDFPKDEGPMGVEISSYEEKKYPLWQAPILGTSEALSLSAELAKGLGKTVWKLITFQPVSKDVAGPLGIAEMTGQAVKFGEKAVLELLGLLSLNLAILNILPFPALDGGRLLFVLIEGVTGRRLRTNWERYIHQAGMAILLFLIVLVTVNDLIRIFSK